MKKFLLPEAGNFYKANMHCHTTISDGKLTPEEVKKLYMDNGYSIVAYTDHDVLLSHPELASPDFLPLNGYEMEFTETGDKHITEKRTFHICCIALDPSNLTQVCYHREKYAIGNGKSYRDKIIFDQSIPDFEREFDPDNLNEAVKTARDAGFFVTLNHPVWSLTNYSHNSKIVGINAMEMYNYSCIVGGFNDINEWEYDGFLRDNKRIFCVGGDDNHNVYPFPSRRSDSCGAFTVIKADKLEYKAITDALLAGNFYASMGPEIKELWFEDGFVNVTTSPADRIIMHTGVRPTYPVYAEKGQTITSARFEVKPEHKYVRFTVFDSNNISATTNAYFTDELFGN